MLNTKRLFNYKLAKTGQQSVTDHCWSHFKLALTEWWLYRRGGGKFGQKNRQKITDEHRDFFYCTFTHLSVLPADALIQLTSIKCSTSATMLCHPLQCHHFYHRSRKLGSLVPGKKVVWLGFPERVSLFCFSACLFLKLHNYYLSSRCPLQFVLAILLFFFIVNSLTFLQHLP